MRYNKTSFQKVARLQDHIKQNIPEYMSPNWSNSEYWTQKCIHSGNIHSIILDVHVEKQRAQKGEESLKGIGKNVPSFYLPLTLESSTVPSLYYVISLGQAFIQFQILIIWFLGSGWVMELVLWVRKGSGVGWGIQ